MLKSWTWREFQALPGGDRHRGRPLRDPPVPVDAEDGYTVERSYSIASADGEPTTVTVEGLDDGEISPTSACGAVGPVAYLRGPGTMVRCRNCSDMLMVIPQIRRMNCVDLRGLTALDRRRRLTLPGSALVRSGRPTPRGPDVSAAQTPGIHAGLGTLRKQPSPPPPVPWTGRTMRSERTDRDRQTGRRPWSATGPQEPADPRPGDWCAT